MLFKNFKRYSACLVCLAIVLSAALPTVLWTAAAELENPLITSFEEADNTQELKNEKIIDFGGDITVNTDETFVCDGNNSLIFRPKKDAETDWDTSLTVNLNESVKNAYGITFKVYNTDTEKSAALRCLLINSDSNKPIKYQCEVTVSPSHGWQTVTVDFENIGLFGGQECYGGTSSGNRVSYDEICKLTGIRLRMPYIGKDHKGVYFDDFQYIFKEKSDDIITAERTLVSFNGCGTGKVSSTENPLPEGVSVLDGSYGGTASIAEDQDGNKLYTVSMDKRIINSATSATVTGRQYIALSVAVPAKYAEYLSLINVDVKNNIKKERNPKKKSYYIVGVTDLNGNYGKTSGGAEELAYNADGVLSKNASDMIRISAQSSFLGTTNIKEKWHIRQFAEVKQLLIYITLPECKGTEGYSVSIGDISITLKGDRKAIESIDEINKELEDFDSADTVEEINSSGTAGIYADKGEFSICKEDAHTAPNSLLYKSQADAVNYNTSLNISLEKRAAGCVGVEFYVKNLDETQSVNIRSILIVGKGSNEKKYQYIKDVYPSENGEYTRIRIRFNDVGVTTDEFWGGTNEGNKLSNTEIEELITLKIRIPYMKSNHAGVLFDSFRLITDEDIPKPEDLVRRMLDFDDCEVGGELPENLVVTDKYGGNMGIEQTADGGKAYRINYDLKTEASAANQIGEREYVAFSITVPKTSLKGASEIRVGMTNNAVSCDDTWSGVSNIYQVVGIRGGGYYGKTAENADKAPDKGALTEIKIPLDKMRRTEGGLTGWCNSTEYWSPSQLADVVSILVYITAPTCDGTEGWSFDINYIDVYYEDAAQNYETETRCAVKANRVSGEENSYISAENIKISKKDPNYTMFTSAWRLSINNAETPKPLKFINTYTNYYTDLSNFTESATLGFYLQADTPLDLQITLQDKAGEKLSVTVPTAPPEISSQYGVYQLVFKDILNKYYEENPDGAFDISNIRFLEVLPIAEDGLPDTVMLSGLSIWTMEIGSAVVYSGYHYSDNGVTVDAYNDYLPMDTVTVVESEEAASAVKNFGIKLPAELTPLLFKTITLYTVNGSVTEPTGKIWLSFEIDPSLDLSEISIYKVFFDGSYIKQRYAAEDGAIAINTFTTGSFLITRGKLKEEPDESTGNKNTSDNIQSAGNQVNFTGGTNLNNTDNSGENTPTTTVKKKIIRKVVRKKGKQDNGLPVWTIVLIAAGSAAVIGGGAVTTVILVKKRNRGGKAK